MNKKISILQLSRGIAALLVLLFHATNSFKEKMNYEFLGSVFHNGDIGVDFFFVLSGFIIFYVHYKDINNKDKLNIYAYKRFTRVYPVYWIATLLVLPVFFTSYGSNFGTGRESDLDAILKSMLLIPQDTFPILSVAWSLSYEILFYILFGILIYFKPKISVPLIICWLFVSVLFYSFNIEINFVLNFLFSHYNIEFAFGAITALLARKNIFKMGYTAFILGVLGFIFALSIDNANFLLISFSASSIIYGSSSINISSEKINNLFNFLGDTSYSIYLTHIPILAITMAAFGFLDIYSILGLTFSSGLVVLIAFLGGCIFHVAIEKQVLNSLRKKSFFINLRTKKVAKNTL